MWLLLPIAALAGAGLYELIRPAAKTGVVQFTPSIQIINKNEAALKNAGIDYEVKNDGTNMWILVREADRDRAVKIVRSSVGLK